MEKTYNTNASLRNLWLNIFCAAAGWTLFVLGIALMNSFVGVLHTPLVMILGLAVIALPSLKAVVSGSGFKALFNSESIIVIEYADGRKEKSGDFSGTMMNRLLLAGLALAFSLLFTPIRILVSLVSYKKACKEMRVKTGFLKGAFLPFLTLVAVMIVSVVVSVKIVENAEKNYFEVSDYTQEEMVQIVDDALLNLQSSRFTYLLRDEELKCNIEISHNKDAYGETYRFTIQQFSGYRYNDELKKGENYTYPTNESAFPVGSTYTCVNGVINDELSEEEKAELLSLTASKLSMLEEIKTKTDLCVINNDKDKIKVFYYYEGKDAKKNYFVELDRESKRVLRIVTMRYKDVNIEFTYQ